MRYIFMNHRIRDKKPDGPVIVTQSDGRTKTQVHANQVAIKDNAGNILARVVFEDVPNRHIKTHEVRAWIEVYDDDAVEFFK